MGAIAARVTKIERERSKAAARRAPRVRSIYPGRLLQLIPRLSPELLEPTWLEPVTDAIEESMVRPVEVCISVPPRHAKTTTLLHAIVWILLNDPTATILYASYAHGFAAKQVRKAMRLAQKAGIALGDTRRRDEWTTAAGGVVKAVGIGGQITGEGFRWIFVDDPHKNRAEAESRQIRERVIDGFLSDIYTRQDPRGTSIFVVHTRWHELDLIGWLTQKRDEDDEEGAPPFEYINLAALRDEAANDGSYVERVALAPQLFTAERLLKIRRRIGEYAYVSLYEGRPKPKGGLLFGDVTLIDELEPTGSFRYAIGIDIAHTARTRSDWNVAVVMRMNVATKMIDVVEVARMQGTLTDRVDGRGGEAERIDDGFLKKLHALKKRYSTAPVVMFTSKDETALIALAGRHDTYPVRIEATLAETDKWSRAQPYASDWNSKEGKVRVLHHAPWTNLFVLEHVSFTGVKGQLDDQVDAAAAAHARLIGKAAVGGRPRGTGQGSEAHRIRNSIAI